jgi:hypothetical protein
MIKPLEKVIIETFKNGNRVQRRKIKLYSFDGVTWVKDLRKEIDRRYRANQLHPGWIESHTDPRCWSDDQPGSEKRTWAILVRNLGIPGASSGSGVRSGGRGRARRTRQVASGPMKVATVISNPKKMARQLPVKPISEPQAIGRYDSTDMATGNQAVKPSHRHRCDHCSEMFNVCVCNHTASFHIRNTESCSLCGCDGFTFQRAGKAFYWVCRCDTPWFRREHSPHISPRES